MGLFFTGCLTLITGLMFASIGEWLIHKYVMHRPLWFITYPFHAHDGTHHGLFSYDYTYHLQIEGRSEEEIAKDRRLIRMGWWAPAVVIPLGTLPFIIAAVPFAFLSWWYFTVIAGLGLFVSSAYFAAYETSHWWMHFPRKRRAERSRIFQWLNGHHILHHRYKGKNFNVVLPFADWLFGTLLLRSPVKFAQVRGPSVPDLQPLAA